MVCGRPVDLKAKGDRLVLTISGVMTNICHGEKTKDVVDARPLEPDTSRVDAMLLHVARELLKVLKQSPNANLEVEKMRLWLRAALASSVAEVKVPAALASPPRRAPEGTFTYALMSKKLKGAQLRRQSSGWHLQVRGVDGWSQ